MGVIYRIVNTQTNMSYIGKTTRDVQERFQQHLQVSQRVDTYLYKSIRKYGADAFQVEVLLECPDDELGVREREMIELHGTRIPNGYNMTDGGDGGNTSLSPRYQAGMNRIRESGFHAGANNAMYGIGGMLGKKHSDETKRRQSEARKRYWERKRHNGKVMG